MGTSRSRAQAEEIASVKSALPVTEFWSINGVCLLMNMADQTYIIRVNRDGSSATAYLSQIPMENFTGLGENEHRITDDVSELQGWSSGWET